MRSLGRRGWVWWALLCAGTVTATETRLDGVAAYVGDAVITISDVLEAMTPPEAGRRRPATADERERAARQAYDEALQSLIDARLIVRAFEQDKTMNRARVERYVDRRVGEIIHERFGGDQGALLEALARERITLDEWRARAREQVIVSLMRNREVESRVVVSPREVREYYEQHEAEYRRTEEVRLRMIEIPVGADGEGRRRAEEVARRAAAGEDFAELARAHSAGDKASAGGDWGWTDPELLREELAQAARSLPVGGVSSPIEVEGDLFVIKVEDRRAGGAIPFEEIRDRIERELRQREVRRLHEEWMARLRRSAHVEVVSGLEQR